MCLKVFISSHTFNHTRMEDEAEDITAMFSARGERPSIDMEDGITLTEVPTTYNRATYWLYTITAPNAGVFTGTISGTLNSSSRILVNRLVIPVSAFLTHSGTRYTSPIGITASTMTSAPTSLSIRRDPDSPLAIGLFNPGGLNTEFIISPLAFREWEDGTYSKMLLKPKMTDAVFTVGTNVCDGSADTGIYDAVDAVTRFVMATHAGIVEYDVTTASYSILSSSCAKKLKYVNYTGNSFIMATVVSDDGVDLQVSSSEGAQFVSLGSTASDDTFSALLGYSVTGTTVVDAALVSDSIRAVVKANDGTADRYYIESISDNGATTEIAFNFPTAFDCDTDHILPEYSGSDTGSIIPDFTAIYSTIYSGDYVTAVGNTILASFDGLTWQCLGQPVGTEVKTFVSSVYPYHAFIDDLGHIQSGQPRSPFLSSGYASKHTGESRMVTAVADPSFALHPVVVSLEPDGTSIPGIVVEDTVLTLISQYLLRDLDAICATPGITINFPDEPALTRTNAEPVADSTGMFSAPNAIYLDRGDSYTFTIATEIPSIGASAVAISATIVRPDIFSVTRVRHANDTHVVETITITELDDSTRELAEPGKELVEDTLTLSFDGPPANCVRTLPLPNIAVMLYSGCPPDKMLVFDEAGTSDWVDQGCDSHDGVPCFYYENAFKPQFWIYDAVTDEYTDFTTAYKFEVIGGGVSSVSDFSSSELANYNTESDSPVWVGSADPMYRESNSITWTCSLGSPCFNVWPRYTPWGGSLEDLIPSSPQYFLKIQVTGVDDGENVSYCKLSTDVTIRLHGLSLEFFMVFLIVLVGTILLCCTLCGTFLVCGRTNKKRAMLELGAKENIIGTHD
ncbi:Cation channel sperm-associated protein subunit gamma [Carpediemonas membranifera]|uniref:Cation channel sperm-associated protein subunit gamma n=1 Tax=Carpediemonas membranifera TaxID=201153 RepID=A0A8J6E7J7_9EUKA|nr:Cation channel sperm-associated protein subunit gamma [Carpediemonas membranifera]|eukprot:KAG9390790.1 Cation channel sperm-associated protein subunit gamma [Carpediemonas membranifera]